MASYTGWVGKILNVDLTRNQITIKESPPNFMDLLGGRGYGIYSLFNHLNPDDNALGPNNRVVISNGPLVGTFAPASARVSIETKSPKTGGLCSSNFGGYFGPELKFAGFDAVEIDGAATEPSVLFITDGKAYLQEMPKLWGLTTRETEKVIRFIPGFRNSQIISIGPAGENEARSACIISNGARAAGRGGSGAVLGSKHLKAIVVAGHGCIHVNKPEEFMQYSRYCFEKINKLEKIEKFREGGTHLTSGAGGLDGSHAQPVRNYRDEYWPPEKSAEIREPVFRELYETRRLACFNCPFYCGHFYKVSSGPYAGLACEGLQTNSVSGFGPNLDNDDPVSILHAHHLCNEYGIDVDTAAASLAWAYELYERGIINDNDTEGLKLIWGETDPIPKLLKQMATRTGFGAILSDGVKLGSERLGRGSEKYALHIKGADLNEQSMRWNKAWAFGIVTANRGSGHLDGAPTSGFQNLSQEISQERFGVPTAGDISIYAENAPLVFWYEAYKAAIDALGLCYYTSYWMDVDLFSPQDYAKLFSLATGEELNEDMFMLAGQKIQNISKAFNTLHGNFSRDDDYPPKRLIEEPTKTGPHAGEFIDRDQWDLMLDAYYEVHGWEVSSGLQKKETLDKLGLQWVADKLEAFGKLPE